MSEHVPGEEKTQLTLEAEFDAMADEYHELHKTNVAITGEGPEYFSKYKVADICTFLQAQSVLPKQILDFGSGIGNSIPYFRKYFSQANLTCTDVSQRSIEVSRMRFPGHETYAQIGKRIPLPDQSQDLVFSACVFHHIPHEEHVYWLKELWRVTRPGGYLAIFEHNPLNPLTVNAVNTCPLDANAKLIRGGVLKQRVEASGWREVKVDFKLFFPARLKVLRPLEHHLGWLFLGAQYRLVALK